jgi:hypothetical protein
VTQEPGCCFKRFKNRSRDVFLLVFIASVAMVFLGIRLNAQSAAESSTPPITGVLTVSGNPHYFKDANGTPIILNGSQSWNTLQDFGTDGSPQALDFDAFVRFLARHGHNFTLLWAVEMAKFCNHPNTVSSPPAYSVSPLPWKRTGPGTATDGGLKFDLAQFNQGYFDRLRLRVKALNDADIYAGVYLFTGEYLLKYRCSSDGYPLTGANNIDGVDDGYAGGGRQGIGAITLTAPNAVTGVQDAYVEKVIDTLNDLPNVLWIVSEEAPHNSTWWNAYQIAHIRAYEARKAHQHPIGYAALNQAPDSILDNSDADWIAPQARVSPLLSCGSGKPACKVNINDSDHSYWEMWNETPQQNRNWAWENFTNGNQALFMDPYLIYYPRETRNMCVSPTKGVCTEPDARYDNLRDNLGYILRYSRKLNLAQVTPQGGCPTSRCGSVCSTSYCLAQTPSAGAEYLVYAPSGGTFTVDLSAMPASRTLAVEWFNPATGVATAGNPIPSGSSSQAFTPPFSGDAVLYLVDSNGHANSGSR